MDERGPLMQQDLWDRISRPCVVMAAWCSMNGESSETIDGNQPAGNMHGAVLADGTCLVLPVV